MDFVQSEMIRKMYCVIFGTHDFLCVLFFGHMEKCSVCFFGHVTFSHVPFLGYFRFSHYGKYGGYFRQIERVFGRKTLACTFSPKPSSQKISHLLSPAALQLKQRCRITIKAAVNSPKERIRTPEQPRSASASQISLKIT